MNNFNNVFKMIRESYEDLEPDFDPAELQDLDFSQFDKGRDTFMPVRVGETGLVEYTYKRTEAAVISSLARGLKPLMIYGESGIGKSDIIRNVAKKIIAPSKGLKFLDWNETPLDIKKQAIEDPEFLSSHYMFIDIRAAELEPIDLRGIELPTSKAPYLDPKISLWIYYAAQPESKGVLFFDEMNQAMQQVFNAMFGVILDRQAGGMKFAKNWGILAASNLGKKHKTTSVLPVALTQRFKTVYLVADPKEWAEWAFEKNDKGLTRIEQDVISYALQDPDNTFFIQTDPNKSQSVANPRNLEAFSKEYRLIKYLYSKPERMDLLEAKGLTGDIFADIRDTGIPICSEPWTNGFIQFIKVYSKLDWDDLAKNAKKYADSNLEQVYAYIYYISKKVVQTLGYGTILNKKLVPLMMDEEQSGSIAPESEWKEGKTFLKQFANIASYLVYNVKDINTQGVNIKGSDSNLAKKIEDEIDGEGEHLATLINTIRASDPARRRPGDKGSAPDEAVMVMLFMCKKYASQDEDINLLRKALKQITTFGESKKT